MLLCLLRRALEIRGAEAFCTTEPGQGLGQRSEGGLSTGSWHQPHVGGTTVLPRTQRLTHKQGKNPVRIAPVLAQYPKEAGIHMATPKQNEEQRC